MNHFGIARSILASCLITVPLLANGHGIWFAQRSGDLALIYGHGAEDLDIIKRVPKVKAIIGLDARGVPVPAAYKQTDRLLLVDVSNNPVVVATSLDNGLWSQGADGKWVAKGRHEVPNARSSGQYIKYAIHIRGGLEAPIPSIPEQRLQITPMDRRIPEKAGQTIRLRVFFDGKPLGGAEVLPDYVNDPDGKTLRSDRNGLIALRIRNQGLNVITAKHSSAPPDKTQADKIEHYASLSFVLPHKPE